MQQENESERKGQMEKCQENKAFWPPSSKYVEPRGERASGYASLTPLESVDLKFRIDGGDILEFNDTFCEFAQVKLD